MRLELSILDDDEDEKIETVQRGSRRALAKKRVQTARKNLKQPTEQQKGPSLTVSEDVYQTLHTMGKFLTQPEIERDKPIVAEQVESLLTIQQEVLKEPIEEILKEPEDSHITTQLENLIAEVRDLEDIIKVEDIQHLEQVIKEKETLLEEVQDLEKAIEEKERLLEAEQSIEKVTKKQEGVSQKKDEASYNEQEKSVQKKNNEPIIKQETIVEQKEQIEVSITEQEQIAQKKDIKEEASKEQDTTETVSLEKVVEKETEVSIEEEILVPLDIDELENNKEKITKEKLKSVQDLVNEITVARQKSKAQIEAIVNDAIANSRLEQSLEALYMDVGYVDQPLNESLTQKEIDRIVIDFFKHKEPSPIYLNITLEDLKAHIDEQILLIMEG